MTRLIEKLVRGLGRLSLLPVKYRLRIAYRRGGRKRRGSATDVEAMDPALLEEAHNLRSEVIEEYTGKYAATDYRILFQNPALGVGVVWFSDLVQCLRHAGVPCETVTVGDPDFYTKWEAFRPNVFVSMDQGTVLRSLNLDFIESYKNETKCIRLFTPVNKYRFPEQDMSAEDRWRLDLAISGRTVDAYFSMMVEDYFQMFFPEWDNEGFPYLCLPHACNPFIHFPLDVEKDLDYFVATSFGSERLKLTWRYLRPIIEQYDGLLAGPGWGFGVGSVDHKELNRFYSRSKIVPSPLAGFLREFPAEITERTFSATACGAFIITSPTSVTNRFFSEDELTCVDDESRFYETFIYYVDRAQERNDKVLRALRRTYREHTYFHRIDDLVNFLETFCD